MSSDTNFSRILNEPAPLPEPVRTSFGVVGLLPSEESSSFVFEYPARRAEIIATRSAQTFEWLAESSRHEGDSEHFPTASTPNEKRNQTHSSPGHTSPGSAPHTTSQSNSNSKEPHDSNPSFGAELGQEAGEFLVGLMAGSAISLLDGFLEAIFTGVSRAEIKKNEATVRRALRENPLQQGIHSSLCQIAAKSKSDRLVLVPQAAVAHLQSSSATNLDHGSPSAPAVDSLLAVRVSTQGFSPASSLNRSLYFIAQAQVRVIRISDGKVLHFSHLDYQSRERTFTDWGAHNAKYLRAEIQKAEQTFAETCLEQLFAMDLRDSR